jgi:hypothetical protein
MIEAIVNRIMRWDSLRNAVFDEVNMYNSLTRIINDPESMKTAAAYWEEKAGWKGWNINNNKYYFNDIEENTIGDAMEALDIMSNRSIGYSTGKWSDDDDIHPTITPLFGPNR